MPWERRGIPHHLLDCLDPGQSSNAGDYRSKASKVLADLRRRRKLPIFAGGTGLYLRALLLGLFEGPARSEALRERLRAMADREGPGVPASPAGAPGPDRGGPHPASRYPETDPRRGGLHSCPSTPFRSAGARAHGIGRISRHQDWPESLARTSLRPHQSTCGSDVRGWLAGGNAGHARPSGRAAHQSLRRLGLPASTRGPGGKVGPGTSSACHASGDAALCQAPANVVSTRRRYYLVRRVRRRPASSTPRVRDPEPVAGPRWAVST
jgi:hypothetical protein